MQISVIIPAYNAAATISQAVTSVLEHGPCAEIIVVDDGSTDETSAAVAAIDPRVRCLRKSNGGANVARNWGASAAGGDYLVFLDADDEVLEGWGEYFCTIVEEADDLVSCGVLIRDVETGDERNVPPGDKGPAYDHVVASFLPGSYAVRRELFESVGGFAVDIPYGEHHELGLRLAPLCRGRVVSVPSSLVLKHHDRSAARRRTYHYARLLAVERKVERHGDRLSRDRSLLANYQGVGAYSAASLGDYRKARGLYMAAFRSNPTRWKDLVRAAVTLAPVVRGRVWTH